MKLNKKQSPVPALYIRILTLVMRLDEEDVLAMRGFIECEEKEMAR